MDRGRGRGEGEGAAMELNGKLQAEPTTCPKTLCAACQSEPKVRARLSCSQLVDRPMSVSGTGRRIWSGQVDYC